MSFARRLYLVATLAVLPSVAVSQDQPTAATVARLADSLARKFVVVGSSPSVAIGITRGGETLISAAFGKADLENDVDATPESVYRIGSVTKQFTSTAIMQLVEAGEVGLDDRLVTHLPQVPEAWHDVTVTQLLNHTSGIPSYTGIGIEWIRRWGQEMIPDTVISLVFDKPMDFDAGTSFKYNNTGYILLGMIIEEVTGDSWAEDLLSRFAEPLGLTDTRNCMNRPLIPRRAHGYAKVRGEWQNAPYLAMSQPYAAGAICSTVIDLARWNMALHSGELLSPESYQMMITPMGAAVGPERDYGFGIGPGELEGHELLRHGGGINGFSTSNLWSPEGQVSISILANATTRDVSDLMGELTKVALGIPLVTPPEVQSLELSERDQYVGIYAVGTQDVTVALSEDGLTMQPPGADQAIDMIYYGDHTFGLDGEEQVRLVFTIEDGSATTITVETPSGTREGKRK